MAQAPSVPQSSDNTPEQVAYKLVRDIAQTEPQVKKDRAWILRTYAECLRTVRTAQYSPVEPEEPSAPPKRGRRAG